MDKHSEWQRYRGGAAILLTLLVATGCFRSVRVAEDDELNQPLMKRAMAKERNGDEKEAVRLYGELLNRNPNMARAHLNLAFLLDKPEGDYVLALYHYQRYLELRPQTEKHDMIAARMRKAKLEFAGTVLHQPTGIADPSGARDRGVTSSPPVEAVAMDTNPATRMATLERDIAALRVRNNNLDAQVRRSQEVIAALRARVEAGGLEQTGPEPARMEPAIRTYSVQRGDNLSKVATRVYRDGKRWRDIFEANRNLLQKPEDIRVGQVLVIPQ
jgi:tetratricopeptide (TPR) repeat protein